MSFSGTYVTVKNIMICMGKTVYLGAKNTTGFSSTVSELKLTGIAKNRRRNDIGGKDGKSQFIENKL